MKLVVVPNKVSNIDKYREIGANAFIFGLKKFSSGYQVSLDIEEIESIRNNNPDIEIFIAANKNIFNDELEELEKALISLDRIKVNGVLFYDLAVLNIKIKNNLSLDLAWNQTHMVTNYNTCNYYYDKGVKYGVASSEITLDEINEIKKNTNMLLFAQVMGYPIMSFSRRTLLENYFLSNNKKKDKDIYVITNNNEEYIVSEEESGDAIYYGKILNGSNVLDNIRADYLILNEFNISEDIFTKTLELYNGILKTNNKELMDEVDLLLGNYRGFFFQKTIYKVKKNG